MRAQSDDRRRRPGRAARPPRIEVVHLPRRPRPVDPAVLRPAAAEVAAGREVERRAARACRRAAAARRAASTISAAHGDLAEHVARGVVGQDRHRLLIDERAGVGLDRPCVQRRARLALAVQHRPVHRHAPAVLRQQRAVHVEGAAARDRRAAGAPASAGSRRRTGSPARSAHARDHVRRRSGRRASSTSIPCRAAVSAHAGEPDRSRRVVACVTTSRTSTPCASSTERHRAADVVVREDDARRSVTSGSRSPLRARRARGRSARSSTARTR